MRWQSLYPPFKDNDDSRMFPSSLDAANICVRSLYECSSAMIIPDTRCHRRSTLGLVPIRLSTAVSETRNESPSTNCRYSGLQCLHTVTRVLGLKDSYAPEKPRWRARPLIENQEKLLMITDNVLKNLSDCGEFVLQNNYVLHCVVIVYLILLLLKQARVLRYNPLETRENNWNYRTSEEPSLFNRIVRQ